MKHETEWRIFIDRKKSLLEMYIDSVLAGDIKNLTIKEECIMLEKLKEKKESVIAELNELKFIDLNVIVEEELNKVRKEIEARVVAEHESKVNFINVKIETLDELIAEEEAKALEESNKEVVDENIENIGG